MPITDKEKNRPVSIRLGTLADVFCVQCKRKGVLPNDAIRDLVGRTIKEKRTAVPLRQNNKGTRIRVTLGELREPFTEWCQGKGVSQSAALRELITHEIVLSFLASQNANWLQLELDQTPDEGTSGGAPVGQVKLGLLGKSDERARLRLRLTTDELQALARLAAQRKAKPQRLVTQIVRAFLLNTANYSDLEAVRLGEINHSLTQIAHQLEKFNTSTTDPLLVPAIAGCLNELTGYVKESAQSLQMSRQRWHIELRE